MMNLERHREKPAIWLDEFLVLFSQSLQVLCCEVGVIGGRKASTLCSRYPIGGPREEQHKCRQPITLHSREPGFRAEPDGWAKPAVSELPG
jgi:hypothetical protein